MSFRTSRQSRSLGASAARTSIRGRYATRLRLGSYIADIVPDDHEQPVIYHCVVQKIGSPEVLCLRQEDTFAAAVECGHHQLERLVKPHWPKIGAIYELAQPEI
jgi:hypothetical protein